MCVEVIGQLAGVSSCLLSCESWELDPCHQAWQQGFSKPAEASCWPRIFDFKNCCWSLICFIKKKKKMSSGTGEMAQWLIARTVLAEGQVWFQASTWFLTTVRTVQFRGLIHLASSGTRHADGASTYMAYISDRILNDSEMALNILLLLYYIPCASAQWRWCQKV